MLSFHKRPALSVAFGFTVIALLGGLTVNPEAFPLAGLIFGLPLVLGLPGYVLLCVVFPSGSLRTAEAVLFSLSVSIALTMGGGFALHLTPWGLNRQSWIVLLAAFTISVALIAIIRSSSLPVEVRSGGSQFEFSVKPAQAVWLGLAVLIVLAAIGIARIGAESQPPSKFTQLWAIPAPGGNSETVQLGIASLEGSDTTYKFELVGDSRIIQQWPAIQLKSGQQWQINLTVQGLNDYRMVQALLYRLDQPDKVYRHVQLINNKN